MSRPGGEEETRERHRPKIQDEEVKTQKTNM
jgi:hypothetical protein